MTVRFIIPGKTLKLTKRFLKLVLLQIQMQIEAGTATSEAQAAAEPTAQILNSDAKFEDEHDSSK